jgi:hypothetical protein
MVFRSLSAESEFNFLIARSNRPIQELITHEVNIFGASDSALYVCSAFMLTSI